MKYTMRYTIMEGIPETGIAAAVSTLKGAGPWKNEGPEGRLAYESLGKVLKDDVIHINNYGKSLVPDRMVRPHQAHTDRVVKVTEDMGGLGVIRPWPGPDADGLISNVAGMVLCVITADCVPVALLDPVQKAIGMVHSGWKGTAAGISLNALKMMEREYGTDPKDVVISIGPHICGDCYEVGAELIPRFEKLFSPEDIDSFFIPLEDNENHDENRDDKPGKYLLNLSRAISISLVQEGVRPENIHVSSRCTFQDPDLNSYRRCRKNGEEFKEQNLSAIVLLGDN